MSHAAGRIWWRIAWRNMWRNRRRTLLTASALAFGFVASVLMIGYMHGMLEEMISNGTGVATGQVRIHAEDYEPERSIHDTMGGREGLDVDALLAAVDARQGVTGAAPRLYGGGLVSSGDETAGAVLMGVDAAREEAVSRFGSALTHGRMPGPGEILLGDGMAEAVGAGVGDEVVLVAPAADGSTGNDLFTVSGIFGVGVGAFDDAYALLEMGSLAELMAMDPGRIHEVAVAVERIREPDATTAAIREAVSAVSPGLRTESWRVFLDQLYFIVEYANAVNLWVAAFIFGMAAFGVANAMLLATFERRREFAVARALGTSGGGIGRVVIYEGILLGLISLAAGVLLAAPLMIYIHNNPIDLSGSVGTYSFAGSAVRPLLTVEYSWRGPVVSGLALVATGIVAALIPAWRAVRVPPADALANR